MATSDSAETPSGREAEAEAAASTVERVKVAIVGGGMAGLAAAWELSRTHEGVAYDITVYESKPYLGGKGASTRDAQGRILEHGLHIWLGFYENAFRMMRECYAEVQGNGWGPDAGPDGVLPHGCFDDAFAPEPHAGVVSRRRSGDIEVWSGFLPPMKGQPGDPIDADSNPFTLWAYLSRCLGLVRALMQSIVAPAQGEAEPGDPRPNGRSMSDEAVELDFTADAMRSPEVLVNHMARMLRVGMLTSSAGLLQGVTMLENWLRERNPAPQSNRTILKFLEAIASQARKQLRDVAAIDEDLRRKTEIVDIVLTILVGLYRDKVFFSKDGLDAINHIDYRKWLKAHGATQTALDSPFITGIYDLVFAYRDGDRERPALAAGQALRGALRMFFSYRGALFWRMTSGMGDAVFSPLYRVLEKKGVRFRFGHELKRARFDYDGKDGPWVQSLEFAVTATGDQPLDAFGCWPVPDGAPEARARAKAFYDREPREGGDDQPETRFDAVVFAMGLAPLDKACGKEFRHRLKQWDAMHRNVKTVATQSAQVWMDKDLDQLGWRRGPVIVSAFDGPFETWADMTRTLASERAHRQRSGTAEPAVAARSVAYFCGVLPEPTPKQSSEGTSDETSDSKSAKAIWQAGAANDQVTDNLAAMLAEGMKPMWPRASAEDIDNAIRHARCGKPHVTANVEGSDRYTLSLPGTIEFRISPLEASVGNMTIAGDWTDCGFNAGCIEAAVMSGMLAAHAISGQPGLNAIVGYHHP